MAAIAGLILAGSQVVFGQTVNVGTSSSTTSGTTTTVTIPVTVTTPAVQMPAPSTNSSMALLDVTAGTGDGLSGLQTLGRSFMTIALNAVMADTANGWNAQAGVYTVPVDGLYLLTTKMRLVDGTTTGINYGLGASTTNSDGPGFLWGTTAGMRNSLLNTRLMKLNKGDQVRMFSYVDYATGARLNSAELIIEQVQ